MAVTSQAQFACARSFVRSLGVLLKSARLYSASHARTEEQARAAWNELQSLLHTADGSVTFGVAGSQLLLDGHPMESSGPSERAFADLLVAAGLASVQFLPRVTQEDFQRLVNAFAGAGTKSAGFAERVKQEITAAGESTIRVNEVRFVAEDAGVGERSMAASLALEAAGLPAADLQQALASPQHLLQLLVAAQGAQPSGAAASSGGSSANAPLREEDVRNVLRLVTSLAQAGKGNATAGQLSQEVAALSQDSQELFRRGLTALAAHAPAQQLEGPLLLQLAEHLAIRYALERFERGEVKVNAVHELLERSSREMATLRKVLTAQEERMARAGLEVESHADVLDRQFWASVPDSGKRAALLSPEAWCIPPRNVRQFVEHLLNAGDARGAGAILLNYLSAVGDEDAQVRRKVAGGVTEMAGLYARCDAALLPTAVRRVSAQARQENVDDVRTALAEAAAHLVEEAAARRDYAALQAALPAARLRIESRLPEFVEDALRASALSPELAAVLSHTPEATAAQVAARFPACQRRDECQRLYEILECTGETGIAYLSHTLRSGADVPAINCAGLLSRLAPRTVEEFLPLRLPHWNRSRHDALVRQLGMAGAEGRGRLLVRCFPQLDKSVLGWAIDEIGMSRDLLTVPLLLRLARGEALQAADSLVRLKAVEALGRLRASAAVPYLRELLEARHRLAWVHPLELRIVAAQALAKMDPQWLADFRSRAGLPAEQMALAALDPATDAPWVRHRRYPRIPLKRSVPVLVDTLRGECKLAATLLSLGGGMGTAEFPLSAGSQVGITLRAGFHRLHAQALVRDAVRQRAAFEIVEMNFADRNRLRRLIAGLQDAD